MQRETTTAWIGRVLGVVRESEVTAKVAIGLGIAMIVCSLNIVAINVLADTVSVREALPASGFAEFSRQTGFDVVTWIGAAVAIMFFLFQFSFFWRRTQPLPMHVAFYVATLLFDGAFVFNALNGSKDEGHVLNTLLFTLLICWFSEFVLAIGIQMVADNYEFLKFRELPEGHRSSNPGKSSLTPEQKARLEGYRQKQAAQQKGQKQPNRSKGEHLP